MDYINTLHNHDQSSENTLGPTLFPNINPEQEVTFEDTNPAFKSATGSPKTHTETWFPVPYEEFTETRHITRAYTKQLGKLPTTS
jgi:hypothetical protein